MANSFFARKHINIWQVVKLSIVLAPMSFLIIAVSVHSIPSLNVNEEKNVELRSMASTDWLVHFIKYKISYAFRRPLPNETYSYISDHNEKLKVALELDISRLEKQLEESSRPGGQKNGPEAVEMNIKRKAQFIKQKRAELKKARKVLLELKSSKPLVGPSENAAFDQSIQFSRLMGWLEAIKRPKMGKKQLFFGLGAER